MNKKPLIVSSLLVAIILLAGAGVYVARRRMVTNDQIIVNPGSTLTPFPSSSPFTEHQITFETISKGYYSGHVARKDYVIVEGTEWRKLWNVVYANTSEPPALPSVDFNTEMVIAVFQGGKGSSGYAIEVTSILEKPSSLEVAVKEYSPGKESIVLPALTAPFHIIKVKLIDKKVIFLH